MKFNIEKIIFSAVAGFITILLLIISFFAKETFTTIKTLEKDVVVIRERLTTIEAQRITREEIEHIIKDYHDNHPCIRNNNTQK
jgi:hypothetical protein